MKRTLPLILIAGALGGCGSEGTRTVAPGSLESRPAGTPNAVLSVEAWTFEGKAGRAVTTPSFRIYTTSPDSLTIARLPGFLEAALFQYRSALASLPEPGARMETYMMPTRPEWERLTKRLLGDRAGPYLRIVRGGYAAGGRGVYFDIGPRDSLLIAAHEGWHQYVQSTFASSLPAWLDEGVGVYMEGFRWDPTAPDRAIFLPWSNPERFDRLREGRQKARLLPLTTLVSTTPQRQIRQGSTQILEYYAQLWALVHFLREGEGGRHAPALARLLQDAAGGQIRRATNADPRGVDVLRAYFTDPNDPRSLDRLSEAYLRFVTEITRPGARHAVVDGRSPISP
jgi:hypothetical protein